MEVWPELGQRRHDPSRPCRCDTHCDRAPDERPGADDVHGRERRERAGGLCRGSRREDRGDRQDARERRRDPHDRPSRSWRAARHEREARPPEATGRLPRRPDASAENVAGAPGESRGAPARCRAEPQRLTPFRTARARRSLRLLLHVQSPSLSSFSTAYPPRVTERSGLCWHSSQPHRNPPSGYRLPSNEGSCPHFGLGRASGWRGLCGPANPSPGVGAPGLSPGAPTECRPEESFSPSPAARRRRSRRCGRCCTPSRSRSSRA